MIKSNPVKGMRDLTPKDVEIRNYVINQIQQVYKKYGFMQIETPCTENIELLSSGEGGDNEKMIFKILKRGAKLNYDNIKSENDLVDMGLRYDLTVPLCRFYANNQSKLSNQFKVIQIGSVWRAERPQKGRFRQFTQCDIDIVGIETVEAETELILATSEALLKIGFENFKVRLNDRRILMALAEQSGFDESDYPKVFIILDKLDKIGFYGVQKELEQSNYPKNCIEAFMSIVKSAMESSLEVEQIKNLIPIIPDNVITDIKKVICIVSELSENKYEIEMDLSLVRGLGYYTGQIFEIEAEGFGSSIAGGGRYDKMIGKFLKGSNNIPACGFSIGFERVISILEDNGFTPPNLSNKLAILYTKEDDFALLCSKAQELRNKNNNVSLEIKNKNVKKQLDELKELGFNQFSFFGNNGEVELKTLE